MTASKLLLLVLLALTAVGCSAAGAQTDQATESSSCATLAPSPELYATTRVAAARWIAATGCDIPVGTVGIPVVRVDHIAKGVMARTGVDPADGVFKVRILSSLSGEMLQHVLDHEMGHVLGVPSTHTDDGLMMAGSPMGKLITSGNLEVVCSVSQCTEFRPE